jgi:hypothetical protein
VTPHPEPPEAPDPSWVPELPPEEGAEPEEEPEPLPDDAAPHIGEVVAMLMALEFPQA